MFMVWKAGPFVTCCQPPAELSRNVRIKLTIASHGSMSAENGKLKIGVRGRRMLVKSCSMSQALIRPLNGASEFSPFGRTRVGQRKRSSSLFALDELSQDPSPPLSPSVSITFNMDSNTSGEIPIIFDFLTTGTMPSEERISKMASLKPALPPLVKFSPMSAFFPMSDSIGSLNTISTEAFGTKRLASLSSGASRGRFSLSDCSAVYSPLSADFHSKPPSPTTSVDHGTRAYPREPIVSSTSAPAVHVLDYDIGQKELADISTFTISAYLSSPHGDVSTELNDSLQLSGVADGRGSQDDRTAQPILSEIESENRILPAGLSGNANANLLSTPSTLDPDDKTPTQSTFLKRRTDDYFGDAVHFTSPDAEASRASKSVSEPSAEEPLYTCGSFLTVPSSPDSDDKTPTQATFLKPHTDPSLPGSMPKTVRRAISSCEGNLPVPESPDYDDTTPTQTTFLQRRKNPDALPPAEPSHAVEQADNTETSSKRTSSQIDVDARRLSLAESRDKDLPAEPTTKETEEEEFTLIKSPAPSGSIAFHTSGPTTALPVPCLRHAQWLRDTIVELWIDQEGFRAIRPKFFLASVSNGLPYSRESSSQAILECSEEHDPLYTTVAEFLPVSRVASYFHRAAFDRGPTLHRITTGDETKDYITRAATISLRDNGVFFVQGTEDHKIDADSHGSGGRIIRLNWRFEYFVSSRRPDGRSAQKGEKVITPLSFSCTPALLHPKRAHKVTVFHIMKKTVLPNLVAQKLEPPDLPMIETHPSAASLVSLTSLMSTVTQSTMSSESRGFVKVASPQITSKPLVGKTDTRNQRGSVFGAAPAAEHKARPSSKKQPHPFAPPRLELPIRPPLKHTKHRRGSYSDTTPEDYLRRQDEFASRCNPAHMTHERSRSASLIQQGRGHRGTAETNNRPKSAGNTKSNPAQVSKITGPIIPQQELMKMLDSDPHSSTEQASNKPVDRRPHSIRVEVVNDMPVTTLPAPPRQRHNQ